MANNFKNSQIQVFENNIVLTISNVLERGFDNILDQYDDYTKLVEIADFRNSIIQELYENYFPPRRHEFEFQIISDLVNAAVQSKFIVFAAGAALSGPIGDLTSYVIKSLLNKIASAFNKSPQEAEKFNSILKNINLIESVIPQGKKFNINKLTKMTGIEKERLIPLLKLLGFKKSRKNETNYWEK